MSEIDRKSDLYMKIAAAALGGVVARQAAAMLDESDPDARARLAADAAKEACDAADAYVAEINKRA